MKYIVEFPHEWYLGAGRFGAATGDIERAARFDSAEEAHVALMAAKKFYKLAARRAAKFTPVEA